MRVGRRIPDDPRDLEFGQARRSRVVIDLDLERPAERRLRTEVLPGRRLGDDDGIWTGERRAGIALEEGEAKNSENIPVGEPDPFLKKALLSLNDEDMIGVFGRRDDPGGLFDLGIIGDKRRAQRPGRGRGPELPDLVDLVLRDAINAFGVRMERIVSQLVRDLEDDCCATS
jgi:hypothetical protein